MRTNLIYLMSSLFLFSSNALAIELCGNFAQGELIVAKDGAKTSLFALKRDEAENIAIKILSLMLQKQNGTYSPSKA